MKTSKQRLVRLEQQEAAGNETGRLFELANNGDIGYILTYVEQCIQAGRQFDAEHQLSVVHI